MFSPITRVSMTLSLGKTPISRETNFDIDDGTLYQYEDYYAMYREDPNKTWPWKARTTQLAGSDVGFVMLKDYATVFTMGDPRYPDCVGRDVTDSR